VVLEPHRVGQRVERKRVLRGPIHAEEVDLGPERQHEVVVAHRLELAEADLARIEVDGRHRVLVDPDVVLLVEEIADRMADRRLLEQPRCDLVEQRLEGVIVVLVDEDDVDVALPQLLGSPDPTEATSEDEDARARGVAGGRNAHWPNTVGASP
jgi:hypothetical protein